MRGAPNQTRRASSVPDLPGWLVRCTPRWAGAVLSIISNVGGIVAACAMVCEESVAALIQCGNCGVGIAQFVFLIQFLVNYGDISEPCDGTPDFEELTKIHTFIIITLILTAVVCFCGVLAMLAQ